MVAEHLTGLPWVAVMHGHTSENKRVAIYNKLILWAARSADRVIAVSAAMGNALEQRGVPKNRIRVISNAVEPKAFQLEKDGGEFRRNCGASSEHLLVGVIRRFSPERCRGLSASLKRVVKNIPFVKAVLIEEGQEADRLTAMVRTGGLAGHVHFAGNQTDISPSTPPWIWESFRRTARGCPTCFLKPFSITGRLWPPPVGGIPEVMQGDMSAWLVRRPILPSWPIR